MFYFKDKKIMGIPTFEDFPEIYKIAQTYYIGLCTGCHSKAYQIVAEYRRNFKKVLK